MSRYISCILYDNPVTFRRTQFRYGQQNPKLDWRIPRLHTTAPAHLETPQTDRLVLTHGHDDPSETEHNF
jgi:hypothetical protein